METVRGALRRVCSHGVPALVLFFAAGVITPTADAAKATIFQVRRDGEAYVLYAQMIVDASLEDAYSLLSDYDGLERLSSIVKDVRLLETTSEHRHRVRSVAELCVLVFCARVDQVQEVYESPLREIFAVTVPEESNLEEGVLHWRMERAAAGGTRLTAFARIVPGFPVPPVVGPWAVRHVLRNQVWETARNIERLSESARSRRSRVPYVR